MAEVEQRASVRAAGRELQGDVRSRSGSAAFGLMQAGLSAKGFEKSRNTMRLNGYLAELVKNFDEYGEYLYHLTVMGVPSSTEPVGLAARRASSRHQLLRARRSGGDDAVVHGLGAGDRNRRASMPARRFCRASRISGSRSCGRSHRTSRSRRRFRRQDREQRAGAGVPRQPDARLRRRARGISSARPQQDQPART